VVYDFTTSEGAGSAGRGTVLGRMTTSFELRTAESVHGYSILERLKRLLRYRLIVPLRRSRQPPEYIARGVATGIFWALTPTVGVQMALVTLHWVLTRRLKNWKFNLFHAWAWTWVTNMLTVLPVYYGFYVTGQIMRGRWSDLTGYGGFIKLWDTAFGGGGAAVAGHAVAGVDDFETFYSVLIDDWGLSILIGCVPWAIIGTWASYRWTLHLVRSWRKAGARRRQTTTETG
jgi:uncharacterized protein